MKLALVIDSLDSINAKKDTSLALVYAAASLGCDVYLIEYNRLYFLDGGVEASAYHVEHADSELQEIISGDVRLADVLTLSEPVIISKDDVDVVLMRKDPPVDSVYWATTYLLQIWEKQGVLVANSTRVLREYNEKCAILQFPELIADTVVASDLTALEYFLQEHESMILKPLDAMGGAGVLKLHASDNDVREKILTATSNQVLPVMVQQVLDVQSTGDKRILLFHGVPLPYVLVRRPAAGSFLANLAAGGSGEVVPLSDEDKKLAEAVARGLPIDELGLIGLDVIGGKITEINVTSPTCLREIQQHAGENYARLYIQKLML